MAVSLLSGLENKKVLFYTDKQGFTLFKQLVFMLAKN